MPVIILSLLALTLKPFIFDYLLQKFSEKKHLVWNAGLRLGQISQFPLLIAYVAAQSNLIGDRKSLLIQSTTIVTLLISSYLFVQFCPTLISSNPKLRRD